MNTPRFLSIGLASVVLATALPAQTSAASAAPRFPAQSPKATVTQDVGLGTVTIEYSRPGVKGRHVIGGTEAFGRVWRTGANNNTKVVFSTDFKFGGQAVPAGTYALFSIPGESEWTVILNKVSTAWGAYSYDPKNDQARVTVKPVKLAEKVETFTIDLNDLRDQSATLNLIWENTKVPVKLEFDVASTLAPAWEQFAASGAKLSPNQYYSAAVFYYDNGLDLAKAKQFIDAATNNDKPAFYMMHWKAKIYAKLGDKATAKAAAEKSKELAVAAEGPQSPFLKMNNDLLASLN